MAGEADVKTGTNQTTGTPVGAGQQTEVQKGLERFAGADGKVDVTKLGTSYLEVEKGYRDVTQKLSTLDKAYKALADKVEGSGGAAPKPVNDPETELKSFVENPEGYVTEKATGSIGKLGEALKMAILEVAHPELKDPKFVEAIQKFSEGLPEHIREAAVRDYHTADWVIGLYKEQAKAQGGEIRPEGTQFVEGPSGGAPQKGGKIWTREEVKNLMAKPSEYAKHADEISQAYRDGRVK